MSRHERARCPQCGKEAAVSPITRHLARHDAPGGQDRRHGLPPVSCAASGRFIPQGSDLLLPLWVEPAPTEKNELLLF
ncbi:hypothetical protein [Streptomyces sp. NPDC047974]|uniref:hypothetical protein n=1 Tax=Streptomyces sp. NPDC047974 TaxID=3154343 RepID=UPI0033F64A2D